MKFKSSHLKLISQEKYKVGQTVFYGPPNKFSILNGR